MTKLERLFIDLAALALNLSLTICLWTQFNTVWAFLPSVFITFGYNTLASTVLDRFLMMPEPPQERQPKHKTIRIKPFNGEPNAR